MSFPTYFRKDIKSHIEEYKKLYSTPFLIMDLDLIESTFLNLTKELPMVDVYYAVKANSTDSIIKRLSKINSCFDLASVNELQAVQKYNVDVNKLSFGNTIKKKEDIKFFYEQGIRLFVTDSEEDLKNIAKYAPGSKVYFRLLFDASASSDWPLSKKFGCCSKTIQNLALTAQDLGLQPFGVSFHAGSQQKDPNAWADALIIVDEIFSDLKNHHNISLQMLNLGGGLPASYINDIPHLNEYFLTIRTALDNFQTKHPLKQIIIEPGRFLVGNAGILISKVILKVPPKETNGNKWLYLDAGIYNGLMETLDNAIHYKIITDHNKTAHQQRYTLAGPTCDSLDTMYANKGYLLPENISSDDYLYWLSAGAYTVSCASNNFNGFEPLKCITI